jgi:diadenosine tetraphosphate (Ap4A) HIT family hydrolase
MPVTPGHALVATKRHVASWFEASREEQVELMSVLDLVRDAVLKEHAPKGFNIGINDGVVAGQTVPHLHVHLIPRYEGDVPDPRGGVRWVVPDKANYLRDGLGGASIVAESDDWGDAS